jgi:hypothetical protein
VEAVVAGSFVPFMTRNTYDQCRNPAPEAFRYLMSPRFVGLIEVLSAQSCRSSRASSPQRSFPKADIDGTSTERCSYWNSLDTLTSITQMFRLITPRQLQFEAFIGESLTLFASPTILEQI